VKPPWFLKPLEDVLVRTGNGLELTCTVLGTQPIHVSWLHNGREVGAAARNDVHTAFDGSNAKLTVGEAYPRDAGYYALVARNKGGEITSTCTVSVKVMILLLDYLIRICDLFDPNLVIRTLT
jgi:hypothetical protein